MKGSMIIPAGLQDNKVKQLHLNHIGIDKTKLLAGESIYWINMNADKGETVKDFTTWLDVQVTWPKDKTILHKIPGRLW